ncbi:uncharacterized protein A1O9_09535 [Exophiala aquamarina CBS 119918]|uniref:4-coumarate-CoA ligase n=1 Tax=Exophiala aquamarina CBS 119918 TaxID=1182545 RepID=A0A072P2P8_9EURO|nr:uncharacterized protein A1O9_09535 [Exophiala aquamarina CBS 119918]KEF54369.1 hypothetical protein A1O9_09535 [Exophiala aquamarina CBS 119918]
MISKSPYDDINIPKCNILSYLFPTGKDPSLTPLWIDAKFPRNSLSPADLLLWVKKFALGLDNLGIGENTAIMEFTPNHLYVPVIYLGAAGSKRYYTGANSAYTADELAYQMLIVKPAVILVHPSLFKTAMAAAKKLGVPKARTFLFSAYTCAEQDGVRDWRTLLASNQDAASWDWDELGNQAEIQIATINFSSGTTGLPKGVCTSHYNLVSNASQVLRGMFDTAPETQIGDNEKWLAGLPLYHAFSQLYTINIACRLGIPVYILEKFALTTFLEYIQKFKITTIQTVSPVMALIASTPDTMKFDLSSLKNVMVGAAPISLELQSDLIKRFGFCISRGWGTTETTCVGTKLPINRIYNHNSIGYLLPNTQAMIVDERAQEIETGPGELWIRGPQMMLGYWKNRKATNDSYAAGGWLKTGDIVIVKDDLWWIVDRKKELIKVNGSQVAPAELEAVLLQHDLIVDAAVVGLSVDGNEYPRGYVVAHPDALGQGLTEEDILSYVAQKVAKHKQLRGGIQFKEAIPRLLSGKIMRRVVKEWQKKMHDLSNSSVVGSSLVLNFRVRRKSRENKVGFAFNLRHRKVMKH